MRRDDGRAKDFKKAHIEFRRYELFHVIGRPKKIKGAEHSDSRRFGRGREERHTERGARASEGEMPFLHNENVPIHKYHGPTLFTAIFFFHSSSSSSIPPVPVFYLSHIRTHT